MVAKCRFLAFVALVALNSAIPAHAQRILRKPLRELPPDIPCAKVPDSSTRVKDVYGYDHVRLVSPDDATQEKITTEYRVPDDLRAIVNSQELRDRLATPPAFAQTALATAEKVFGQSEADIAQLSPRDAVKLAAELTHHLMTYIFWNDVDWPSSPERILEAREGDCKHYSRLMAAVFQVLKSKNPYLKNTYVVDWPRFVPLWNHAFNTCVIVRATEIQVFYRDAIPDPSFSPGPWHVPQKTWKAMFYLDIGDEKAFRREFARIRPGLSRSDHSLLMYDLAIRLGHKKRYAEAVMLLEEASYYASWKGLKVYAYSHLADYYDDLGNTRESKIYQYLTQQMDRSGLCTDILVRRLRRYVWSID